MTELGNLLAVSAIAAAVPLLRGLLPRIPFPGPVLELLAGILVGPAVLGLVELDDTLRTLSLLGLAFLLFLAGSEIELERLRGPIGRQALLVLLVGSGLALAVTGGLGAVGAIDAPLLVAVAMVGTSLGLVIPLLADSGLLSRPVGQTVVAGASSGELASVLGLSVLFGMGAGQPLRQTLLIAAIAGAAVAMVLLARRSTAVARAVSTMADTAGQLRVRLAVLLVLALAVAAEVLGFELILGAFIAGVLLRSLDPGAMTSHPHFRLKLDGLAYGFLVPVFFVVSGLMFDLDSLLADPAAVLKIPLFLGLLLLVRAVPALLYRGLTGRERVGVGLLQATSLPLFVTAAQIGTELGMIGSVDAAALVAAGLVSVLVLPAVALRLLAPSTEPSP